MSNAITNYNRNKQKYITMHFISELKGYRSCKSMSGRIRKRHSSWSISSVSLNRKPGGAWYLANITNLKEKHTYTWY